MRMTEWMKRGLAALGLATLASCTTADAAPSSVRPALWRVSDADTSIYLFGTFHLLPQDYAWQTPQIRKAVAKSSDLYVETILDEQHPQAILAEL
ncbi:MAG: TraB/GumN family protein, partial [Sphingomicrobium sp.]